MPGACVAFEVDGEKAAAYHYGPGYSRPFVFPLVGPAGYRVTRLGHPHDPEGHSHHLSVWVGHRAVNGVNFWEDGEGRIVHDRIEALSDGPRAATLVVRNTWRDGNGNALVQERRSLTLHALPENERCLDITLELRPAGGPVTFGATPFGFLGIRVAKTMSVNDGDGIIRNSEGGVNEEEVFWKPARWVDYSGGVAPGVRNGIALFDHPGNPGHPTCFHVRNDGWMGPSACKETPCVLGKDAVLTLRYRIYVHGPLGPDTEGVGEQWRAWVDGQETGVLPLARQ